MFDQVFTRYWWSQWPSNLISHIITLISFCFGAAGNYYSIYHLLRCSIITGAGYWVQEFNKFRPTRRHSNKKDKKERHILEHNQNGLHGRRKAFYGRVAHGVVNLMFSPTVDELALKKKTLLPVYPSQVFKRGVAGVSGIVAHETPDTGGPPTG